MANDAGKEPVSGFAAWEGTKEVQKALDSSLSPSEKADKTWENLKTGTKESLEKAGGFLKGLPEVAWNKAVDFGKGIANAGGWLAEKLAKGADAAGRGAFRGAFEGGAAAVKGAQATGEFLKKDAEKTLGHAVAGKEALGSAATATGEFLKKDAEKTWGHAKAGAEAVGSATKAGAEAAWGATKWTGARAAEAGVLAVAGVAMAGVALFEVAKATPGAVENVAKAGWEKLVELKDGAMNAWKQWRAEQNQAKLQRALEKAMSEEKQLAAAEQALREQKAAKAKEISGLLEALGSVAPEKGNAEQGA